MPTNESLNEILDKAWEKKSLAEILEASPEVLQGVSEGDAEHLKAAFGIKTVKDFATCKYFLWAQAIAAIAPTEKV